MIVAKFVTFSDKILKQLKELVEVIFELISVHTPLILSDLPNSLNFCYI